ncbi:hypothetical protein [Massilia niabensis]|uniref:Peptidase C-terminal archaeal/bacterial domain-containing protein n=1 Tax=Massilia niabensis TaxID=544910 RepID=A0ABW0L4L9_9BURK
MARKSKTWCVTGAIAILGATALPVLATDKTNSVKRGKSYIETTVDARDQDEYRVRFGVGQTANVRVDGDNSSDLDLFVLNGDGDTVCSDEDLTDNMVCNWVAQGGTYTIQIVNLGEDNHYRMEYY